MSGPLGNAGASINAMSCTGAVHGAQRSPDWPREAPIGSDRPQGDPKIFTEAERSPERPRDAQGRPEKPKEDQRGPERPTEAERNPERPREAQRSYRFAGPFWTGDGQKFASK